MQQKVVGLTGRAAEISVSELRRATQLSLSMSLCGSGPFCRALGATGVVLISNR